MERQHSATTLCIAAAAAPPERNHTFVFYMFQNFAVSAAAFVLLPCRRDEFVAVFMLRLILGFTSRLLWTVWRLLACHVMVIS